MSLPDTFYPSLTSVSKAGALHNIASKPSTQKLDYTTANTLSYSVY